MCDKDIKIRAASRSDCEDIYVWLCDPVSLSMFFNTSIPSYKEHKDWFNSSLNSADRKLYIGEVGSMKIGICRFDRNKKNGTVEVSINLDPNCRGSGFGKRLLESSIRCFQKIQQNDLLARIKPKNVASLKIFKSLKFQEISSKADVITLVRCDMKIILKEVDENDTEVLFGLLKQRVHSISHNRIPTRDEHNAFVKAHPYRHWAIILEDNCPIGTFYLQNDNSVGLNISEPSLYLVSQVLAYIRDKFKPFVEMKSKVPPYFYVNASYGNEKLGELLINSDAIPIQISYKI